MYGFERKRARGARRKRTQKEKRKGVMNVFSRNRLLVMSDIINVVGWLDVV